MGHVLSWRGLHPPTDEAASGRMQMGPSPQQGKSTEHALIRIMKKKSILKLSILQPNLQKKSFKVKGHLKLKSAYWKSTLAMSHQLELTKISLNQKYSSLYMVHTYSE